MSWAMSRRAGIGAVLVVVVDGERRRLHAHGDDDTRCGLAMLHRVMDRLSRLLDTAMIVWLFPGAAGCRLTSGGGGDGIQEHVEDDAAAFGDQGEQGDAATEGVQLPEADGLQGASINGGGASDTIPLLMPGTGNIVLWLKLKSLGRERKPGQADHETVGHARAGS